MPLAPATPANAAPARQQRSRIPSRRIVVLILVVAGVALCAMAIGLSRKWPFAQARVLQDLREASDSQVQVRTFHQTFFPSPGCTLEALIFRHSPSAAKPLITIERLTIQGSYLGLLSQRVSRITAVDMVVTIPPFGSGKAFHITPSKTTIAELVANGSVVQFVSSDPGKKPLRFDIHEALLKDVGWKDPLAYQVKVHNPEPPGEVTAEGKFGVWNKTNAGETPISGAYKFEQADLSVYEGIAGTLSSTGKFAGKLSHIDISGGTDTPDFQVKSSSHSVRLTSKFSAYVDATKGNTFLEQVDADFWKTHIVARGSVATSANGEGKTALIDVQSRNAHIEDLLLLFVKEKRAPMSGDVTFQARAELPPGEQKFLKKIKLRGSFGVGGGSFSQSSTQKGVDELSAGARGEKDISKDVQKNDNKDSSKNKNNDQSDPETVLTDLQGQVNMINGIANFSDLSFRVPAAHARVHGTYNLINYKIDLRGQMRVDSQISNTTTGAKAFLLKAMNPFFRKKPKGEIVPVRIGGNYNHPTFGLDLDDKKAQNPPRTTTRSNASQPPPRPN